MKKLTKANQRGYIIKFIYHIDCVPNQKSETETFPIQTAANTCIVGFGLLYRHIYVQVHCTAIEDETQALTKRHNSRIKCRIFAYRSLPKRINEFNLLITF